MKQVGIILAAGASRRMGRPKALLPTPGGPLAAQQAARLRAGGCARAIVVLGCDADSVRAALPDIETVVNADWERGRFSSVQTGLRAAGEMDGGLILPVDTVGILPATIRRILEFAAQNRPAAIRPICQGRPGKIAWISGACAADWLARDPDDTRLDLILKEIAWELPVDDAAILRNVNTPAEWDAVKDSEQWAAGGAS